jgi:hypothetical protein
MFYLLSSFFSFASSFEQLFDKWKLSHFDKMVFGKLYVRARAGASHITNIHKPQESNID